MESPSTRVLLMLLSLTTKYAHTVTAPGTLVGTRERRYRIRTSSNRAREHLVVKHTIAERSASARITIVALHLVVFRLSYLYFPKGSTMTKIIERTVERIKAR
jgi:hypothetical protein